jgi:hypothetical protein
MTQLVHVYWTLTGMNCDSLNARIPLPDMNVARRHSHIVFNDNSALRMSSNDSATEVRHIVNPHALHLNDKVSTGLIPPSSVLSLLLAESKMSCAGYPET